MNASGHALYCPGYIQKFCDGAKILDFFCHFGNAMHCGGKDMNEI